MSRMAALTFAPMSSASGSVEQVVEAGVGREIEDAFGVICGGFVHARAAAGGCGGFFQLGALRGEADFGEAQEDEAEDGRGVFLGLEAGVGAELVNSGPCSSFQLHQPSQTPRTKESLPENSIINGKEMPQREGLKAGP